MASITVRNLEGEMLARLRLRAVAHGRSLEEVRVILRQAIDAQTGPDTLEEALRALRARARRGFFTLTPRAGKRATQARLRL